MGRRKRDRPKAANQSSKSEKSDEKTLVRSVVPLSGLDPSGAIRDYFKDPDWMFKTGLGGVLNASSLVVLAMNPLLLAPVCICIWAMNMGFVLRTMREKVESAEKLPEWKYWMDLFISGMMWFAIVAGQYGIVLSIATLTLMVGNTTGTMNVLDPRYLVWSISSITVIALAWLVVSIFSAVLMTNYAVEEKIASGFAFGKVFKRLKKKPLPFVQAWLLGIGLHSLAFILPSMTLIGIFIIPSVYFAAQVISAVLWAQAWRASEA